MFGVDLHPVFENGPKKIKETSDLAEMAPHSGLLRFQLLPFFFRRAFHVKTSSLRAATGNPPRASRDARARFLAQPMRLRRKLRARSMFEVLAAQKPRVRKWRESRFFPLSGARRLFLIGLGLLLFRQRHHAAKRAFEYDC